MFLLAKYIAKSREKKSFGKFALVLFLFCFFFFQDVCIFDILFTINGAVRDIGVPVLHTVEIVHAYQKRKI